MDRYMHLAHIKKINNKKKKCPRQRVLLVAVGVLVLCMHNYVIMGNRRSRASNPSAPVLIIVVHIIIQSVYPAAN